MASIKTEIFQKQFTTTPKSISAAVASLCSELSPGRPAVRVPVDPEPDAVIGECFHNVQAKVAKDGGSIAYGWLVWEWPRVFVEAEHHAVWSDERSLIDITPHIHREPSVLFLPDPQRIYDYEGKKRIINVKRSLGLFKSVDGWISASDLLQHTLEQHLKGGKLDIDRDLLKALSEKARMALAVVIVDLAINTRGNDACLCSSGKKFKTCCAPLIDLTAVG
ncbi:SEC-C domain-containing protein [Bradyrhizobium sp. Arg62]|uniref:SEC-C metal-binding domain-containing protein n=1 Tax=Bradyrhizobium brasilense TaxID=1419277 RepID=UPI001E615918|nr:SEC-C metal-binding domain-containing protein [Bradyrhizobium brasilense]MCC8951694.1 SEC-C domain-containing protein [Bradyrhizobium brasilense]